jgi:hypothetical protein
MNPPLLPVHFFGTRPLRQMLPGPIAWFRALCLLPLAMPGVKVVLSGFALFGWLEWLGFPLGLLAASILFLVLHILIPILVAAGFYHVVRTIWPAETTGSWSRNLWFASSTIGIIVLSFVGTVGVAALAEMSVCQVPQAVVIVGGSCSNHFLNKDISEILGSMETYNFRYYNWLVWIVITAFLYRFETRLRERYLSQLHQSVRTCQEPVLDVEPAPELDHRAMDLLDLENSSSL